MFRQVFLVMLVVGMTIGINAGTSLAEEYPFANFPAKAFKAAPAPLNWDPEKTFIDGYIAAKVSQFFNYQSESLNPGLRFGGHYLMETTGCGTACQTGIMFDLRDGKAVAELPVATSRYMWRSDSNLLVVNPPMEGTKEELQVLFWDHTTYFYVWDGKKFVLLGEVPWPM